MLYRWPAADQLENENDQSNKQQDVDISSQNVESDKSQQPQNQQNDKDSPKHKFLSVRLLNLVRLAMRGRA